MRTFNTRLMALPLLMAGVASAGPLAYAPNSLYSTLPNQDDLIVFDVDDPAGYTVIGPMGHDNIGFGGLEFDADGNLWAWASFYRSTGGAASGLYSVDVNTGLATPVGNSPQSLEDLAYNPVDGRMYGVRTQGTTTRLYTVNLTTGVASLVGTVTSNPPIQRAMGLAIDSQGAFYIHDMSLDAIFKGTGLAFELLHSIPQDTNYSQGMTIDWSRDDTGYHAAVGQGEYPNYFSQLNTFTTDGSAYTLGDPFGPLIDGGDGFFYPPVECGDVAIPPATKKGCPADVAEPFGVLNFFDLSAFLALFNAQDDAADFNNDGQFNFFDLGAYLDAFNAGCP